MYALNLSAAWIYRSLADTAQVLDSPEPLRNLSELLAAQIEYHKKAYEALSELAPVIDGLQTEQDVGRTPTFHSSPATDLCCCRLVNRKSREVAS